MFNAIIALALVAFPAAPPVDGGAVSAPADPAPDLFAPTFHAGSRFGVGYLQLPVLVQPGDAPAYVAVGGGPGLSAAYELWPMFAPTYGLGGFVQGMAGTGLASGDRTGAAAYQYGARAFVGRDDVATLVGTYGRGGRVAGVLDGFEVGLGGLDEAHGEARHETERWGVSVRGCSWASATGTCKLLLELGYNRERLTDGDVWVDSWSARLDWRDVLGLAVDYAPTALYHDADGRVVRTDEVPLLMAALEWRNDVFSGTYW